MRSLLDRLTYANVVATLALFIAVGTGGAYAVSKIDGSDIRNRSLTGREFKANSIGGKVIRESSLRPVPRAQNSARLGGQPASRFLDSCPQAFVPTVPVGDVCVETQARLNRSTQRTAIREARPASRSSRTQGPMASGFDGP